MTEIEQVKQQIKVLEAKLSFLEEVEKHKTPAEEEYKQWWGKYPGTEPWCNYDETRWVGFRAGYKAAQSKDTEVKECSDECEMQKDTETLPTMFNCIIEGEPPNGYAAWNEWYENEGSKGILHNLRISYPKNRKNHKIPHNDIDRRFYVNLRDDAPKSKTLFNLLSKKLTESYISVDDMYEICDIVEDWLPDEYQSYSTYNEGWNDYRTTILENLK